MQVVEGRLYHAVPREAFTQFPTREEAQRVVATDATVADEGFEIVSALDLEAESTARRRSSKAAGDARRAAAVKRVEST